MEYQVYAIKDISIHALREEGDRLLGPVAPGRTKFLSTPSARRATAAVPRLCQSVEHFYPRPPRGGRPYIIMNEIKNWRFLSTPSARRATTAGRHRRRCS